MMNKRILWLTATFSLQIIFALSLFLIGNTNSNQEEPRALLNIDPYKVDKISISDGEDMLTMINIHNQWSMPEHNNLPANQRQITALLEKIADLKTTWPVITTASGHPRFEVSEDVFRKKIELFTNDTSLGILYIGTSPGFKKSHLRVEGYDSVYALAFNDYDAPASHKEWLDKSLLATKPIHRIKGSDYEILKKAETWTFTDIENAANVNQEKAEDLSTTIGAIKIMALAQDPPEFTPAKTISITVESDKSVTYRLLESDSNYYIKRSDIKPVFRISKNTFEGLTNPTRASLTLITEKLDHNRATESNITSEESEATG